MHDIGSYYDQYIMSKCGLFSQLKSHVTPTIIITHMYTMYLSHIIEIIFQLM